jgi:hypothetical protein
MATQTWKIAERNLATTLQRAAGRVRDHICLNLVTSTGRVGHLVDLGFDVLVGNPEDGTAIVGEAKRRKVILGAEALRALIQIWVIGIEWDRVPLFGITFADNVPQWVQTKRGKKRIDRNWTAVPLPYMEDLLRTRRLVAELRRDYPEFNATWEDAQLRDATAALVMVADDGLED